MLVYSTNKDVITESTVTPHTIFLYEKFSAFSLTENMDKDEYNRILSQLTLVDAYTYYVHTTYYEKNYKQTVFFQEKQYYAKPYHMFFLTKEEAETACKNASNYSFYSGDKAIKNSVVKIKCFKVPQFKCLFTKKILYGYCKSLKDMYLSHNDPYIKAYQTLNNNYLILSNNQYYFVDSNNTFLRKCDDEEGNYLSSFLLYRRVHVSSQNIHIKNIQC